MLAVTDDVPDDKEVARKAELCDKSELVFGLLQGTFEERLFETRAEALANAFIDAFGEEAIHGVVVGDRIAGEFIAEVVEREFESLADDARVGNGFRQIAEECVHLARWAEVAKAVLAEESTGFVEGCVVANGCEDVEEFAIMRRGAADSVGGDDGETQL